MTTPNPIKNITDETFTSVNTLINIPEIEIIIPDNITIITFRSSLSMICLIVMSHVPKAFLQTPTAHPIGRHAGWQDLSTRRGAAAAPGSRRCTGKPPASKKVLDGDGAADCRAVHRRRSDHRKRNGSYALSSRTETGIDFVMLFNTGEYFFAILTSSSFPGTVDPRLLVRG